MRSLGTKDRRGKPGITARDAQGSQEEWPDGIGGHTGEEWELVVGT